MRKLLIALSLCIGLPVLANGDEGAAYRKFTILSQLLEYTGSSSPVLSTYGIGYVVGLTDKMTFEGEICVPAKTKAEQVTQEVRKRLLRVPVEYGYLNAGLVVHGALLDIYPCGKSASQPKPWVRPSVKPESFVKQLIL